MMHEPVGDPSMGIRSAGSVNTPQQHQQPLPSVSHVMGPPPQYRPTSYSSPQSSQPATPLHPTNIVPPPSPGMPRVVTVQSHNQGMAQVPPPQPSAPPPYVRPPTSNLPQGATQLHVSSSTQNMPVDVDRFQPSTSGLQQQVQPQTPKEQYRLLKKRFKFLVYENECYQEELRNLQRKLLKLSRDKNFLLDRLIQYEKLSDSSDDSDSNSVKTVEEKPKPPKKKSRTSAPRRRTTVAKARSSANLNSGKAKISVPSSSLESASMETIKAESDGTSRYGESSCQQPREENRTVQHIVAKCPPNAIESAVKME